jgi:hypothetical protein
MEYLMTYGWALLVIVVVGAALFALGVLNPSTYTQERCQGFGTFQYQGHQVNTTHFALDVINAESRSITVTSLSIGGTVVANPQTTPSPVPAGQRFVTEGDYASTAGSYNYNVVVTYNVAGGIQGKTDVGTCLGTV